MAPETHALLSPSSSSRWLSCAASVVLNKDAPDDSSDYAREGTWAHRLGELKLLGADGFSDEEIAACVADGFDPADFEAPVTEYVNYVKTLGSNIMVEVKLPLGGITGEAGAHGTSDAVVLEGNTLHVCDLKYGKGERVEAVENTQLLIYAGAAFLEYGWIAPINEVVMHIIQPRIGNISTWSISKTEMLERLRIVGERAGHCLSLAGQGAEALSDEEFHPGPKACRWCQARGKCTALAHYALSAAGLDLPDYMRPTVDGPHLAWLLGKVDLISSWVKAVEKYALEALTAGVDVPGFKLVQGKAGNRKWADEDKAEKMLKGWKVPAEYRYNKSLISPAQAEKLIKLKTLSADQWDELGAVITREPGRPTVAPLSDKRPAISGRPAAEDYPDESLEK